MSDQGLRDLERRWQASGTVEDEVAYLEAWSRTGPAAALRVRVAAELGHPAALVATPDRGVLVERDPVEWVR